jgi:hypothetical protein
MTENNHNKSCGLAFTHDFGRIPFFFNTLLPSISLIGIVTTLCPLVPLPHFHLFKDIVISYWNDTS